MATKPAASKAAATKAKAAPAPAPAEIEAGNNVKFLGYGDDVPEEERVLEEGAVYPVSAVEDGSYFVQFPNPDFDEKKKVSDKNPERLEIDCFAEEIELTDEPNVFEDDGAAEEQQAEEVAAPAPAPAASKAKTSTKAAAPAASKAEKTPAGKGKAAAAPAAAAKGKGKAAAKEEPAGEDEGEGDLVELEGEDESVLAIVHGEEDIIAAAQGLEAEAATSEYRLGGVLRHILKTKAYLEVEGGQEYAEPGGFKLFLSHFFNIDYRKAMYLIQIYEAFTLAGIEDPAGAVAKIGWTKASKIAGPMLAEGANADDLITLAERNTVSDLSTVLTEQVKEGVKKEGGEIVTRTTLKFRFLEDEAATVTSILDAVKEKYGLKDIQEAMLYALSEFHANDNEGTAKDAPAQAAPATKSKAAAPRRATAKA